MCRTCHGPIPPGKRADAQYCSKRCKGVARWRAQAPERASSVCQVCRGPIPAELRADARYCSAPCRTTERRARAKARGRRPTPPSRNAETTLRRGGTIHPPVRSPFRILARSCQDCGLLISTPPELFLKAAGYLPACPSCRVRRVTENVRRRRKTDEQFRRKQIRRGTVNRKRTNDALTDTATNHRKEWTGPELEIIARPDLSASQAAKLLGRTLYAVKHMRRKLMVDPRKIRVAGSLQTPHVGDVIGASRAEREARAGEVAAAKEAA